MEARSQLTTEDLILDYRAQTLHKGNHKTAFMQWQINSGERRKEERKEGKNYSENFFWILSQNKQTNKNRMDVSRWFYISLLPKTTETDNLKLIQSIIEREKKKVPQLSLWD